MPNYRRAKTGITFFFTVVTFRRRPILCLDNGRAALREAIADTRDPYPFAIDAWVLLPDHLHCMWTLPDGDTDFSVRWALIKRGFTKRVKTWLQTPDPNASRHRHREESVWQRRFWEHTIRDERDFETHCDYIHYNPVRHGLAETPRDWPYSTFHKFVETGIYPRDWGAMEIELPDGVGNE